MGLRHWEQKLIQDIYHYGGFLPKAQVDQVYLRHRTASTPPTSDRYLQERKKYLRDNQYVQSSLVNSQEQHTAIEVFYLGVEGARVLAGKQKLSGADRFVYRKHPPRHFDHDWLETHTHMAFEQACNQVKKTKLLEWLHEFQLRRRPLLTTCYNFITQTRYEHEVVDDSFCRVQHNGREYRFFWEIDNETRREPELTLKRLIPQIEMIRGQGVEELFGGRPFRRIWLCKTQDRLGQIKTKIEDGCKRLGVPQDARYFLLLTVDQFSVPELLTRPVYHQGGETRRVRLFAS